MFLRMRGSAQHAGPLARLHLDAPPLAVDQTQFAILLTRRVL
jgi:hypothetical protein